MNRSKNFLGFIKGEVKDSTVKSESLKEGLRINLNYFTLTPGEHSLALIYEELEQLVKTMDEWREGGWNKVSAQDSKHQEIIPLMKGSGRGDMAAARGGKPKGPLHRMGMIPRHTGRGE